MTLPELDSRWLYLGLVALVALERLVELAISRRNANRLSERGGFEVGREHYPPMVLLHTGLLAAGPLEVWLFDRPLIGALAAAMLAVLAATMVLRYWVIATLGDRWTTRVYVVPGESAVRRGPYRWLRHPNYLAVVLEIVALAMIHTAWMTALVFSLGNALVLRQRIHLEEEALDAHSDYRNSLGELPRLVPRSRDRPGRGPQT